MSRLVGILASTRFLLCAIAVSVTAIVGCSRQPKEPPKIDSEPVTFATAFTTNVVPLADGGAYRFTLQGGVWYMREGQAAEVVFPTRGGKKPDLFEDITPTADGGAYATCLDTVWYLKGTTARAVEEVPNISSVAPHAMPPEQSHYFAAYVDERAKRRRAEDRLESIPKE